MGAVEPNLVPEVLLFFLAAFIFLSGAFIFLIIRLKNAEAGSAPHPVAAANESPQPETPPRKVGIARPGCWLAIKTRDRMAVQRAFGLHGARPCSWAEALSGDSDQKLYVASPVSGWVLVFGSALPDPAEDVDDCFRFLLAVSRKLGQVQYFRADAVLNHHAWARLDAGRVLRGYAWAGRTLWHQGHVTADEYELNLRCRGYTDTPDTFSLRPTDHGATNSEKVHLLAARWSIDPEAIDARLIQQECGVVGELPGRL